MRGSPFFDGVRQIEATIADQSAKLPIFYYDGSAMTAMFPARYGALRRLLPDPRFVPARLAPGVGMVGVSCFEYRDTDVGPYNELAVSVVLNWPHFLPNLPARALASMLRSGQLHAYVHHLPVTTEAARAGGVDYYNYPKFVGSIEFSELGDERVCHLAEGEEPILTLRARRIPAPRSEEMQIFSHLYMDRQPQSSEFKISARQLGICSKPGAATLELAGRHPIATELSGLLLSRRALHLQYMPDFEGILYGPEHLTLPFLARAREELALGA